MRALKNMTGIVDAGIRLLWHPRLELNAPKYGIPSSGIEQTLDFA